MNRIRVASVALRKDQFRFAHRMTPDATGAGILFFVTAVTETICARK